jgi:lysyl-tRNA synthetase class I
MPELTKEEARAVRSLVRTASEWERRYGHTQTIFNTHGVRPTRAMLLLQAKFISLAAQKLGDEWDA